MMNVNSDRCGQLSVFSRLLCIFSFSTLTQIWQTILSASWPLQQRRQGQPRHGHCRPSGGSAGSYFFDCDISVLEAQDRCCLTGQPMAQQSFGAFGPMKVWDLSGLWEREIQTGRDREKSALFLCSAVRRSEWESKQQQRLKTIWLFHVYTDRHFIFDSW